jgi:preprotein translocase subunit SecG
MLKFILCIFLLNLIQFTSNEKLIFASLHSRHGARAPLNCDENMIDFVGEKWTVPGELTNTGHRMEYILGLRNRQRYITGKYKFLSNHFDPHEILVCSTNVNRTLLSMTSQLQGLYPLTSKAGHNLTPDQIKVSIPPVNISYEEIENEIDNLNTSALPNFMTVIPIHTTTSKERKMNVQDSPGCKNKVNKTRDHNKVTNKNVIDAAKFFNDKYTKNLSNYYEKNVGDFKYDFDWIGLFCDTLVSDYSDGRKMEDFLNRTNIQLSELLPDCRNMIKTNFRDDFFGDENNSVILLAESNLIKEVLHYMKQRVDEDMKEKVQLNVSDYSKPKMLIYSGHDATLTGEELFMIKHFGLKIDEYIYPTYTTQLAFEVTRDDEKPKPLTYSSYTVTFYVNDKPLIVKTFDEFKKTVEKSVWNAKQIDDFCDDDAVQSDESDKSENNSSSQVQLYLTICLGVLALIFLMIIIILVMKLNQKTQESGSNNNEGPLINEDEN